MATCAAEQVDAQDAVAVSATAAAAETTTAASASHLAAEAKPATVHVNATVEARPLLSEASTTPSPPHALQPKLKVVIPPVPPFLHEVDKRNERERVRLLLEDEKGTAGAEENEREEEEEEDPDYKTPEKQQQAPQKRKARSALDEADEEVLFEESEYRMSQITPPPSERMLDHKNPPLPPRKAKKRRRINRPLNPITGRMTFSALPLPRLSSETSSVVSSPPRFEETPPGSPRSPIGLSVFRSLADEFAAVQETPPLRTLRPPPRITRAARQCTPPISSRTRGAIQTPTTTMVLRSRQLNPSKTL